MAFRGTYEHTLDDRGRVAIPAKYRASFAQGAILTIGPEGCVEVYTPEGFEEMSKDIASESPKTLAGRRARRRFDAQAFETELDRQGRILIPVRFRQMARLNGAVVIIGRRECLEIWEPSAWQQEERASLQEVSPAEQGPGD